MSLTLQTRISISVEETMTPTKTTNPAITATPSKLPRQQTTVLCPITGYPCNYRIVGLNRSTVN